MRGRRADPTGGMPSTVCCCAKEVPRQRVPRSFCRQQQQRETVLPREKMAGGGDNAGSSTPVTCNCNYVAKLYLQKKEASNLEMHPLGRIQLQCPHTEEVRPRACNFKANVWAKGILGSDPSTHKERRMRDVVYMLANEIDKLEGTNTKMEATINELQETLSITEAKVEDLRYEKRDFIRKMQDILNFYDGGSSGLQS